MKPCPLSPPQIFLEYEFMSHENHSWKNHYTGNVQKLFLRGIFRYLKMVFNNPSIYIFKTYINSVANQIIYIISFLLI